MIAAWGGGVRGVIECLLLTLRSIGTARTKNGKITTGRRPRS